MPRLSNLLLALDLGSESVALINRVQFMYPDELAHLHIVHVIKNGLHTVNATDSSPSGEASIQRVFDHKRKQIVDLLNRQGVVIPDEHIHLLRGEPSSEIKRLAEELHAELVIVGSHTKADAWLQLPGATTNCVIQGISSDVMAVKV